MLQLLSKIPYFSLPFFAEIFLLLSGLVLLVVGAFVGDKKTKNISWALTGILMFAILILSLKVPVNSSILSDSFTTSQFLVFSKMLMLFITICCLALYISHLRYNSGLARFEFPIMILFSLVGMMVMVSSNDFLTFYMGLELQGLSIYVLTAFDRNNPKSAEAGLKYFILGSLASIFILYGISIVYGLAGTIQFQDIAIYVSAFSELSKDNFLLLIGLILLLSGLLFKVSAFPFHMWTPDVYEGASTPVTTYISTVPKIAVFVIFFRILNVLFFGMHDVWEQIIYFAAVSSMLVGSFGALNQTNFKRLLAYASISHVGFMLIALLFVDVMSHISLLTYIIIYAIMTVGAFSVLIYLKQSHRTAEINGGDSVEEIELFSGLGKTNPILAFSLTIILVSMAGIPPFAGFFAKFFILMIAVKNGYLGIVLVAAFATVVSAFYYLKIIKIMYFNEEKEVFSKKASLITIAILFLSVAFNIFYFISPFAFLSIVPQLL